jgi:hypothetical protein
VLIVERKIIMFPNNPSLMQKLAQTKQEDLMRGIEGVNEYELQNIQKLPNKAKMKSALWAIACLLIALAWYFV